MNRPLLAFAFALLALPAFAQEEGTLGLTVQQLYSQAEASHRGNLVVLDVQPKSAADDAGIRAGEVILEVNGKPVTGRDLGEIRTNWAGPLAALSG